MVQIACHNNFIAQGNIAYVTSNREFLSVTIAKIFPTENDRLILDCILLLKCNLLKLKNVERAAGIVVFYKYKGFSVNKRPNSDYRSIGLGFLSIKRLWRNLSLQSPREHIDGSLSLQSADWPMPRTYLQPARTHRRDRLL